MLLLCVARRAVPRRRDDKLVVCDFAVLDLDPVSERSAGSLDKPNAFGFARPALWFPALVVEGGRLAGLHAVHQFLVELLEVADLDGCRKSARCGASERGEQRIERHTQLG